MMTGETFLRLPREVRSVIAIVVCIAVLAILFMLLALHTGLLLASGLFGGFLLLMAFVLIASGDGPDFGES